MCIGGGHLSTDSYQVLKRQKKLKMTRKTIDQNVFVSET